MNNNQQAFLELVRAGLWEDYPVHGEGLMVLGQAKRQGRANGSSDVDWQKVYQLAEEQSVVGLVLAGIDWFKVHDLRFTIPQEVLLQWIGEVQMIEQQNTAMNQYIAELIERLRKADIYALLVKGQGIAQCYERPLWRASGDVDLLLSDTNYEKAKAVLLPLAKEVETEYKSLKHLAMTMDGGFVVELHGMLHSRLSDRIDRGIDDAQKDVFFGGNVRSWMNRSTSVFLPSPDNDVIFIFTHILKHFYIEGIGLRQICDWCRLLWTYRDSLDYGLLEKRIRKMGLMTEWKAFYNLSSRYLGMPDYGAGLMVYDSRYDKKADWIMDFVLMSGNFGHNREIKRSRHFLVGKIQAAWFKMGDFARHARVFPLDSVKFYCHYVVDGVRQAREKKISE